MTGLMDSIAIKDINRAANKVLEDMITDNNSTIITSK